jgi:hypothetical protein
VTGKAMWSQPDKYFSQKLYLNSAIAFFEYKREYNSSIFLSSNLFVIFILHQKIAVMKKILFFFTILLSLSFVANAQNKKWHATHISGSKIISIPAHSVITSIVVTDMKTVTLEDTKTKTKTKLPITPNYAFSGEIYTDDGMLIHTVRNSNESSVVVTYYQAE